MARITSGRESTSSCCTLFALEILRREVVLLQIWPIAPSKTKHAPFQF